MAAQSCNLTNEWTEVNWASNPYNVSLVQSGNNLFGVPVGSKFDVGWTNTSGVLSGGAGWLQFLDTVYKPNNLSFVVENNCTEREHVCAAAATTAT